MLIFDDKTMSFRRSGTPEALTPEEKDEMRRYSWWQSIPFENGTLSPGLIPIAARIEKFRLAELDLRGKSDLGIGCFEGFARDYA